MAMHYDDAPISLVVDDGVMLVFQILADGGTVVTATFGIRLSSGPSTWVREIRLPCTSRPTNYLGRCQHDQIQLPRFRGSPASRP
jgi:hypothetical protein